MVIHTLAITPLDENIIRPEVNSPNKLAILSITSLFQNCFFTYGPRAGWALVGGGMSLAVGILALYVEAEDHSNLI